MSRCESCGERPGVEIGRPQLRRFLVFGFVLMMFAGLISVVGFAWAIEYSARLTYDQNKDAQSAEGPVALVFWGNYLTQRTEAFVMGATLGLIVTITLVGFWLGAWLNGGRKRLGVFGAVLGLMAAIGSLAAIGLTSLFDHMSFASFGQYRGVDGTMGSALWDLYLAYARESYVMGSAVGLIMTVGLVGMWLGVWLNGPFRKEAVEG